MAVWDKKKKSEVPKESPKKEIVKKDNSIEGVLKRVGLDVHQNKMLSNENAQDLVLAIAACVLSDKDLKINGSILNVDLNVFREHMVGIR